MRRSNRVLSGVVLSLAVCAGCSKDPEREGARYLEQGNQRFAREQFQEAIIEYRNAVQQTPRSGTARLKLAEAYLRVNDLKNGFREYVRAADLLPGNTEVQLKAGGLLFAARQYEDAKTRAQSVLARDPKNVDAQVLLANATAGMKDLNGAVADMEEAIRLEPGRASTYSNLGALELARGNRDEATAAFRKAVEMEPKSVSARHALANYYLISNQRDLAEQTLEEALALAPKDPLTNRALATLAIGGGRPEAAEPYLGAVAAGPDPGTKLWVADAYLAMGRAADALRQLDAVAAAGGATWVPARVRTAGVAAAQGDRPRAHQIVDEVLAKEPKAPSALELKARLLLADQKPAEAVERARAGVAAAPQSASAQYTLGLTLLSHRKIDEARKAFEETLRLNPRAGSAQMQLARINLASGRAEESAQLAQEVLKAQPANPEARLILVRSQLARRDTAAAGREIAPLLQAYPNVSAVHASAGMLALQKQDGPAARRALTRAVELDARNLEAVRTLALLDIADGKGADARGRADRLLAANPASAPALVLAGETYARAGDPARAEQLLKQAIGVSPDALAAYAMLAQIYVSQRKLDAAREEYRRMIDRQPKSIVAHTMLGMLYDMDRRGAEAEKAYQAALAIDGRAAVAANNLAWLYVASDRNLDQALQLAQTAKAAMPEDPNVADTLGWIYYKREMYPQALEALKQSVRGNAGNPIVHYHLGATYVRLNDWENGRQSLKEALRLNPRMEEAGEAEKMLRAIGG